MNFRNEFWRSLTITLSVIAVMFLVILIRACDDTPPETQELRQ